MNFWIWFVHFLVFLFFPILDYILHTCSKIKNLWKVYELCNGFYIHLTQHFFCFCTSFKLSEDIGTYFSPWYRCSTKVGYQFNSSLNVQSCQIDSHFMTMLFKSKIWGFKSITHSKFLEKIGTVKNWF